MSEPVKLQNRLSAEFEGTERRDASAAVESGREPHSPEPQAVVAAGGPENHGTLRSVIAGVGLLCAALVLATGLTAGFYISAAALGLTGIAGSLFLLWQGNAARRGAHRRAEHDVDRDWEKSETSEILSAIHDMLGDIVVMRSLGGRVLQCNSVLRDMLGDVDPVGKTCEEAGLVFRSQGKPHRYDVEIATVSGARIYAWHDITVRDPESGDLVIQSIARDVTEERRAEDERELARRRAEEASEAKSRLLATVSHEIRTPLSGILGMSHLIGQTRLTLEQKNYLAGVRQSGHALVQLVDDLLDFSTIEAGRFQLRPSEEPVRPLLESVVEMLSPRAHEKGIEIGSFVSPDVPALVTFDAPRLRQVLYNVVGNAVKFTHSGGITLEAQLDRSVLVITVTDTGPGMSAEEQARVFTAFEQAGAPSQRNGGTGLGLAISARILGEAGGSLTLSSTPGKGSRFVIRMPVGGSDAAPAAQARHTVLSGSRVFLFAPVGPASLALGRTIGALGGHCHHASTVAEALDVMQHLSGRGLALTDIVVDNRLSGPFRRELADVPAFGERAIRRIYLVNPEERTGRAIGNGEGYDAWLIRPLRERSLVEVLRGRMKGIEIRDAINDNRPVLNEPPAEAVVVPSGGHILLAEDDAVNAMLVRSMLQKAGYRVRLVGDYPSLLAAFDPAATRPDLVITDFGMPGGDGLEVIGRICARGQDGAAACPPVVVLTADTRAELRRQLMAAGASAVLAKPAEPQALLSEIGRLMRRAAV